MSDPLPDPFADHPDWAPRPPRPIEIVPATGRVELRGQRVLVGLPGLGWRGDLRADDRVVQGSRTYVPVIPEHEWYRAESDQVEVFAPLVPVERVWVETVGARRPDASVDRETGVRLVSLDAPPHRAPTPVFESHAVTGRRVVHVVESVEHRDLRAVTETYSGAEGDICVRVAPEVEWYRWAWRGQPPTTLEVPVHLLWIE
ncbi:hypothetical protein F6X68_18670 [Micromonospora sp. AMSO12t]|uniref:hypothetical protein n=1 Tax=unclassified Micromonospora TaxID=2617518 RepID=UPI00124BB95E|nr:MULTISPECIES: hypothetical protein [unclassified Micromonospora]KAB1148011.1 hypothetical protein F6X68_18670 [Micromonospora sp. AMSO12t]WSG03142.1 hypothetical protein OG989_05270 [Micromonospora sp. NBC_01740]